MTLESISLKRSLKRVRAILSMKLYMYIKLCIYFFNIRYMYFNLYVKIKTKLSYLQFQALSNCLPNSQTKIHQEHLPYPKYFEKISGVCDLLKPLIVLT